MKTLCFDFDGVLHSHLSGWKGAGVIPDPPVDGMVDAVKRLQALGWDCVVCSSRARTTEGARAIREWLKANGFPAMVLHEFKPPAELYIDDRGLRFNGSASAMLSDIDAWTGPWNKQS